MAPEVVALKPLYIGGGMQVIVSPGDRLGCGSSPDVEHEPGNGNGIVGLVELEKAAEGERRAGVGIGTAAAELEGAGADLDECGAVDLNRIDDTGDVEGVARVDADEDVGARCTCSGGRSDAARPGDLVLHRFR